MDEPPAKRLRILALHSFRTSASIFEDQLRRAGILTGDNDNGASSCFAGVPATVDFLNAPNAASGPPPPDVVAGRWPPPYREWFAATRVEDGDEDKGDEQQQDEGADSERGGGGGGCEKATRRQRRYRFLGLEDSERMLARALREGAYDGIVGFSQGAAMAAAMVAMQMAVRRTGGAASVATGGGTASDNVDPWAHVRADLAAAPLPSFLVCIGAAMAPHRRHLLAFSVAGKAAEQEEVALPLPLPTAHLIGDRDPVRPFSGRLAAAFDKSLVLRHARGHVVPRLDEAQGRRLRGFLREAAEALGGRGGAEEEEAEEEEQAPPPRPRLLRGLKKEFFFLNQTRVDVWKAYGFFN
jgi:hypothetical protein